MLMQMQTKQSHPSGHTCHWWNDDFVNLGYTGSTVRYNKQFLCKNSLCRILLSLSIGPQNQTLTHIYRLRTHTKWKSVDTRKYSNRRTKKQNKKTSIQMDVNKINSNFTQREKHLLSANRNNDAVRIAAKLQMIISANPSHTPYIDTFARQPPNGWVLLAKHYARAHGLCEIQMPNRCLRFMFCGMRVDGSCVYVEKLYGKRLGKKSTIHIGASNERAKWMREMKIFKQLRLAEFRTSVMYFDGNDCSLLSCVCVFIVSWAGFVRFNRQSIRYKQWKGVFFTLIQ